MENISNHCECGVLVTHTYRHTHTCLVTYYKRCFCTTLWCTLWHANVISYHIDPFYNIPFTFFLIPKHFHSFHFWPEYLVCLVVFGLDICLFIFCQNDFVFFSNIAHTPSPTISNDPSHDMMSHYASVLCYY